VEQETSSYALTVVPYAPSAPLTAVTANFHVLLVPVELVGAVLEAVCVPVNATQFVAVSVTTVRVSAAPLLAYSVPPTLAVPVPPLKLALTTEAANTENGTTS
jgi:hypothetical protein